MTGARFFLGVPNVDQNRPRFCQATHATILDRRSPHPSPSIDPRAANASSHCENTTCCLPIFVGFFFFILSFFFIRLFFSKVGGSSWTLLVYFASEYYSFDYACRSEKRDSSRIFPMTEEKKTYALFSCNGISSLELKDLMTILILPRIYNLTFKSL